MKGLFIPEITVEMFRNGCLESIETLMAAGEIYDIDYEPKQQWIPCSEKHPSEGQQCWIATKGKNVFRGKFTQIYDLREAGFIVSCEFVWMSAVEAWMPFEIPEPYKGGFVWMSAVEAWMPFEIPEPYKGGGEE